MLWGLASNHTIPSSTYKHVIFDPLLQTPINAQCTLLPVTCNGGMLSLHPSDVVHPLLVARETIKQMVVHRATGEKMSS